jgi:hypothetical protein
MTTLEDEHRMVGFASLFDNLKLQNQNSHNKSAIR